MDLLADVRDVHHPLKRAVFLSHASQRTRNVTYDSPGREGLREKRVREEGGTHLISRQAHDLQPGVHSLRRWLAPEGFAIRPSFRSPAYLLFFLHQPLFRRPPALRYSQYYWPNHFTYPLQGDIDKVITYKPGTMHPNL
ncbi:hypothetical protein GGP41_008693 [Bipolaris sorokiniana]|uniref:Uncharacterized protein n=1 Tax=Cochliobolus sativus TaxID=45130 RepID=A0A8H5Z8H6_COCSA|nr:hypothetical protein GGP41_008693 [Bipolaris sorokiniana]